MNFFIHKTRSKQEWNFVALRNTCNTLQQDATRLIINNLSTANILSLTKYWQWFSRLRGVYVTF